MTFLDGGDRNEVNMAGDEYATSYITGGGALTIDTVDVWHAVTGFGNELVNNYKKQYFSCCYRATDLLEDEERFYRNSD